MRLKRRTLTEQVAGILEKQIRSGQFVSGRRLSTTRELAGNFGVSQQVIKSALKNMADRGLVLRKSREGNYVNPAAFLPKKKEFVFLEVRRPEIYDNYMTLALALHEDYLWSDVNCAIHSFSCRDFDLPSLRYELDKISDLHPDCLVVHYEIWKKEYFKFLTKLSFPVVFIGDFNWEEEFRYPINQIVEDTAERARAFLDVATENKNEKEVVLIDGELSRHYARLLKDAAEKKASSLGIKFRYVELPQLPYKDTKQVFSRYRDCVNKILAGGVPSTIIIDGFRRIDILVEILSEAKLRVGKDIHLINDREFIPGTIHLLTDYTEFARKVKALIDELLLNPKKSLGHVVLSGLIRRHPIKINKVGNKTNEGETH
jgi:DNA-binding transcriptional regulator YhcF (GntR family)